MSVQRPELPEKLGKYEIRAVLGRGAMGVVYRAYDPGIDRIVALKVVEKQGLDPEKRDQALARFMVEARAAGRLMHPNVVGVFEFDEDQDFAFIAMEYIDGEDLKTYIKEHNGRVPLDRVRSIMRQLLAALEYSHAQGVVHRDIKPANVFTMRDGTVKLGDFGIAKLSAQATSVTQAGTIMGTPNYMSPEHFSGKTLDRRSDLFSVGVMLYELLTGRKPFSGDVPAMLNQILNEQPPPPSRVNPTLPGGLDTVVGKAMAKRRSERYRSAAVFAAALESAFTTGSRLRPVAAAAQLTDLSSQGSDKAADPKLPELGPAMAQADPAEASENSHSGHTGQPGNRKAASFIVSPWGDTDYRTLGEAVRLAEPYDRILVQPGSYDESLYIDKPLVISGKGEAGEVLLRSATSHCLKIASDGVRISNLSLRGMAEDSDRPALSISRGNCQIDNCDISSRSRLCVAVRGFNSAPVLRNCRIHDSRGVGVHFAMNSGGKLENCILSGHKEAAVRVDKGAHPEITGGSVHESIVRHRAAGRPTSKGGRSAKLGSVGDLFSEAAEDAVRGGMKGATIGLAAGLVLLVLGMGAAMPLVGLGIGLFLGFMKAGAWGSLIGCLIALVLMPLSLPDSFSGLVQGWLGQVGLPAIQSATDFLESVLKGGFIGALSLVFCGAYQQWQELLRRVDET